MCFSSFSNDISLVFIVVCAGIKDIYFKVKFPDLTVRQKIKDNLYNSKKTIFPSFCFLSAGFYAPNICLGCVLYCIYKAKNLRVSSSIWNIQLLLPYIAIVGVLVSLMKCQFSLRACSCVRSYPVIFIPPSLKV